MSRRTDVLRGGGDPVQNPSMSSQEQPEDRQPDDQPEAAESGTTQDATPADGVVEVAEVDGATAPEPAEPDPDAVTDDSSDIGADADADAEVDPGARAESDGARPTEDERLEQLTERIDKARDRAEEAGVLVDTDEAKYADSGVTEEEDDQTITPPG